MEIVIILTISSLFKALFNYIKQQCSSPNLQTVFVMMPSVVQYIMFVGY